MRTLIVRINMPCNKCKFMGRLGKASNGDPVAWCKIQHIMVVPEIGCQDGAWILNQDYRKENDDES